MIADNSRGYESGPTTADDFEQHADGLVGDLVDNLARSFTIGRDEAGYDHHYYRPADAVVVWSEETGVDHRQQLDGRPILEWIAYVEQERGWLYINDLAQIGIREDSRRKEGED